MVRQSASADRFVNRRQRLLAMRFASPPVRTLINLSPLRRQGPSPSLLHSLLQLALVGNAAYPSSFPSKNMVISKTRQETTALFLLKTLGTPKTKRYASLCLKALLWLRQDRHQANLGLEAFCPRIFVRGLACLKNRSYGASNRPLRSARDLN